MNEKQQLFNPAEVAAMYEEHAATEIHELTGLKIGQIYGLLREAEVEIQPRGHRVELENPGLETINKMLALGYSQRKLAKHYRVSKRTLERWMGK